MNTTNILLIDNSTNEIILCANKRIVSDYIHIPYDTVVNWFRNGNNKVQFNNYSIMSIDKYINKMGN